jgi:hypothetical protein
VYSETIARDLHKLKLAQDAVRPVVGDMSDCYSADMVYRRALQRLGHDVTGINGTAAAALWPTLRHQPRRAAGLAMDSKQADHYRTRFPGAFALKQR